MPIPNVSAACVSDEVLAHAPDWFKRGRKDVFDVVYEPLPALPRYEFVQYLDEAYWKAALAGFHFEFDKLKTAGVAKDTLEVCIENERGEKPPKFHFFPKAEDWFVVSDVFGMPSDGEPLARFKVGDDVFRIVKSRKKKCERCWKRTAPETLCLRCQKAVEV